MTLYAVVIGTSSVVGWRITLVSMRCADGFGNCVTGNGTFVSVLLHQNV